jgi:hypothetical protein
MKFLLSFLATIFVTFILKSQGEFKLYKKYKNADINYLTVKNINSLEHGYNAMIKFFEPVKGEFNVYIFIKEFKGIPLYFMEINNPDSLETFHDMIILKTNKKNEIVDGFYYRLEWAEVPSQFLLFRTFCDPIQLIDNLIVGELKLLNEYEIYTNHEITGNDNTNEFGQRILKYIQLDKLKF